MTFRTETTLAGYARAAVDLKARMADYGGTEHAHTYVQAWIEETWHAHLDNQDVVARPGGLVDAVTRAAGTVWALGEPFVLAPAMTAIVAAAAAALDLSGDLLAADAAPCDGGALFLPEPIYHRKLSGTLTGIAAITWTPISSGDGRAWLICGWADRDDPDDPHAQRIRGYIGQDPTLRWRLGPYVLTDINYLPIARPVPSVPALPAIDGPDRDWQTAPDGRYIIADADARTHVAAAIAYAFWRISAQPLATVARPPLDRAARRRAARASIAHDTRVVMLRRTQPRRAPRRRRSQMALPRPVRRPPIRKGTQGLRDDGRQRPLRCQRSVTYGPICKLSATVDPA